MSGGFFRGTSADQDTRFSDKQAKLLKSQKFAPELDHLVDMAKVKMDVIRPWIANRVTELLGFEDEVLINFIYGLLDGKEVNGKKVQISLTGFMEKNTGKFMKELWSLLLSAQKNESGVPQQFLDAKAEETQKKQAELDRITTEIQKKKEKDSKELERERLKKMDGGVETKASNADMESALKGLSGHPEDKKETDKRNGVKGRNRASGSPVSVDRSPSSPRASPSRISKSFSNSRSYSGDRQKSRSVSRSPEAQGRSISSDRVYRSPRKQSITPRRKHSPRVSLSPPRRRSSYSRHRSPSPVWRRPRSPFRRRLPSPIRGRRSPSPIRRRQSPSLVRRRRSPSPMRRRSPSPFCHRSPSPIRRRSPSPMRRRSPPLRRRSPSPPRWRYQRSPSTPRHRSPLPMRRRSPFPASRRSPAPSRRRSPSPYGSSSPSPVRHRSPIPARRRSPAFSRRRSPSPYGLSSPSPVRHGSPIPARRRSPAPSRRRSPSPYGSSSPSPVRHRSPLPVRRRSPKEHRRSLAQSPSERVRTQEKLSPVARQHSISSRSPERDEKNRKDLRKKLPAISPSPERSPIRSESPQFARNRSASEDRRSSSPYKSLDRQKKGQIMHEGSLSPLQKSRERLLSHDSPQTSLEEDETQHAWEGGDRKSTPSQKRSMHSSIVSKQKDSPVKARYKDGHSPERLAGRQATECQSHPENLESRKSEKDSGKGVYSETPGGQKSQTLYKDSLLADRHHALSMGEGQKSNNRDHSRLNSIKDSDRHHKSETEPMLVEKVDHSNGSGRFDSEYEESDKRKNKEKRKHKRSRRRDVASEDDYSDDSEIEERKEAKRRRKEEKKLRKEEKRRRREERRRRREERRAAKLKLKDQYDANSSDDEHVGRRESHPSDDEETQSEQKKLEFELRKKALESLKAKKGVGH